MLQAIKSAAAAFCAACMISGILIRLMPQGNARRCINAIAGLYILVTLLSAVPVFAAELPQLQQPAVTAQPGQATSFSDRVLAQSEEQLAQHYQTELAVPQVEVVLARDKTGTYVQEIVLVTETALSEQEKEQLTRRLQQELQPVRIQFKTKDSIENEER